ncbi:MAG: hypothetical protein QM831_26230 [Kofleriaceae bacterium]
MRIGELLQAKGLVRASDLEAALDAQFRTPHHRICSLLISRGALDLDDASRLLGEQRGYACALEKHLANRDMSLPELLLADFGRASHVLPIGRTSGGALIVAARDPNPALHESLKRLLKSDITLVVAPATRLEHLIAAAYGAPDSHEFDIDLDSAVDLPAMPPQPNVDMLDPDSVRMALSSLDDERVSKDPSQSGLLTIGGVSGAFKLPTGPTLDATKLALGHVATREAASDLAMSYIAGRWRSGAIVILRDDNAIGYRGHGIADLAELHLPLKLPSTISRVFQTRKPAQTSPASPAQDQLLRVFHCAAVNAAPVFVGDDLVAALAAGDSVLGAADTNSAADLVTLARALGDAYDRIRRT